MKTYGLIGYPLGHSFSRGYFTDFFERENIDAEYKNFELPCIEMLREVRNKCTNIENKLTVTKGERREG